MKELNSFSKSKLLDKLIELKEIPNSYYWDFRLKFCYHTNKIEGSTITLNGMISIIKDGIITDKNVKFDDVLEAMNSLTLFDYVIDTANENLNKKLIREFHQILKSGTNDDKMGLCGCFKRYNNKILGTDFDTSEPMNVESDLDDLLNLETNSIRGICEFHRRFERIHPFQDGNGRVGRFIMLRQLILINKMPIIINEENSREYRESLTTTDSLVEFYNNTDKFKV